NVVWSSRAWLVDSNDTVRASAACSAGTCRPIVGDHRRNAGHLLVLLRQRLSRRFSLRVFAGPTKAIAAAPTAWKYRIDSLGSGRRARHCFGAAIWRRQPGQRYAPLALGIERRGATVSSPALEASPENQC